MEIIIKNDREYVKFFSSEFADTFVNYIKRMFLMIHVSLLLLKSQMFFEERFKLDCEYDDEKLSFSLPRFTCAGEIKFESP